MTIIKNILTLFVFVISSTAMSSEVTNEVDALPIQQRIQGRAKALKDQYLKTVYGINDQFALNKQSRDSILSPLHKNARLQIEHHWMSFNNYIAVNGPKSIRQAYTEFLTQPQISFSKILNKVAYLHAELGDWADRLYFENNTGKIKMFIERFEPTPILIRYFKCYSSPELIKQITASDELVQNCALVPPKFFMDALDFLQQPDFLPDTTQWGILEKNLELFEEGIRTPYPLKSLEATIKEWAKGLEGTDPEILKD